MSRAILAGCSYLPFLDPFGCPNCAGLDPETDRANLSSDSAANPDGPARCLIGRLRSLRGRVGSGIRGDHSAWAYGLAARSAPEFAEIRLRDFIITGQNAVASGVPPGLQIPDYPGSIGLYILQLRSAARGAWLSGLRQLAARIIQYLPQNSYIIALPPSTRPSLSSLPGFRHAVVLQPAYKLERSIRDGSVGSAARRFLIQLDKDQPSNSFIVNLQSLSGQVVTSRIVGPYLNVSATLLPSAIPGLASDSRVIWIEPIYPVRPSDERACQVIAGNHDGLQAVDPTGYEPYLYSRCAGCLTDLSGSIVNVVDTGLDNGAGGLVHQDIGASRIASWRSYFCPSGDPDNCDPATDSKPSQCLSVQPQEIYLILPTLPARTPPASGRPATLRMP